MSRRWIVEREAKADFDNVTVFRVGKDTALRWNWTAVWWHDEDASANCTQCSGPLAAMLASCRHISAVRHFLQSALAPRRRPDGAPTPHQETK